LPSLSFCVAIKNRTNFSVTLDNNKSVRLRLFERNIDALSKLITPSDAWEMCVCDFGSTDVNMAAFLKHRFATYPDNFTFKLCALPSTIPFSRGLGLNRARDAATAPVIFYYDADMLLETREVIDRGMDLAQTGKAYFPIVLDLQRNGSVGSHRLQGFGMSILNKSLADSSPVLERQAHGYEDRIVFLVFDHAQLAVRETVDGYFHQWHPTTPAFKNAFAGRETEATEGYSHNCIMRAKKGWELLDYDRFISEFASNKRAAAKTSKKQQAETENRKKKKKRIDADRQKKIEAAEKKKKKKPTPVTFTRIGRRGITRC
jgi:hypothetical protein